MSYCSSYKPPQHTHTHTNAHTDRDAHTIDEKCPSLFSVLCANFQLIQFVLAQINLFSWDTG